MIGRRCFAVKYLVPVTVCVVIYSLEFFLYNVQPLIWNKLNCQCNDASCTKILFVGDPQIQGDEAVSPPLSYLFNWDSDRYLKKTFTVAFNHFQPDIIIYMGDLMDEGSIATVEQYTDYVQRLHYIFQTNYPVEQIWIPGDNDIGGENEPVRRDKLEAFEKTFKDSNSLIFRNISFYLINAITSAKPFKGEDNNTLIMVLSHYPVTGRHVFGNMVNNVIKPDIYFAAHDHESKYVTQNKQLKERKLYRFPNSTILNISFGEESLYEIQVPTCSYRMGTKAIGFGAAVIEKNNQQMRYTVFWSPERFPSLFLYLFISVCSTVILVFYVCILNREKRLWVRKMYGDKEPLLA